MSVPVGMRQQGKLEVLIKARSLAVYTLQIVSNKKKFPEEYHESLGKQYVEISQDIFDKVWFANSIRVTNKESREKRKQLQSEAVKSCLFLLAKIDLGAEAYKLPTKRIIHWSELVIEVRELIKKWQESDRKRYAKIEEEGVG